MNSTSKITIIIPCYNEKKNNLMSEKYIMAGLKINSGKKKEGANLLEEIILSKNKFYSILS